MLVALVCSLREMVGSRRRAVKEWNLKAPSIGRDTLAQASHLPNQA